MLHAGQVHLSAAEYASSVQAVSSKLPARKRVGGVSAPCQLSGDGSAHREETVTKDSVIVFPEFLALLLIQFHKTRPEVFNKVGEHASLRCRLLTSWVRKRLPQWSTLYLMA